MAEEIVVTIAQQVLLSLGSFAIQQIGLAWGFTEELKKMESTVSTINNALLDAQESQMNNRVVKGWLQRLKLILYDADDLFDEVATETRRREVETRNSWVRKVRYFFKSSNPLVFHYVMGSKLNDIEKKLENIVIEMRKLEFIVTQVERPIEKKTETCPLVNTRSIIGREGDKENLVGLLLYSGYKENVLIIPIVGIGGLGKTTLAQLVYDDHRIKNRFTTKRLWVCISKDFDFKKVLLKILQADGDNWNSSFNEEGLQQLQKRVTTLLSDNKFLLVLDDVWNDNLVKWKRLEDLLITGVRGSRIVVTTRSERVASIVRTSSTEQYKLGGLANKECLTILVNLAFREGEENNHKNLVNIGKQIVKKCGGVPLAVVSLGSLLFPKRDQQFWEYVRDSEMRALVQGEDDILAILKLSYDQMPSNLKNCFAYCSLFEKDEIIDGKKLLYAWMAQGFVQCDRARELEDIGEEYILELVRIFFLEPYDGRTFSTPGGRENYKMYSLVHDLAQCVAGKEYLTIKGAIPAEIPKTVRHVSFDSFTYPEFPRPLVEDKKLRTIFYPRKREHNFRSCVEIESESFRCLRLLEGCTFEDGISSLEKIGKLKLLRYLGFNGVGNLPKSLCKLLNLQYLDLSLSWAFEWPKDFGKLIDLRFLCLKTRLKCLPKNGFCRLTSLRTLIIFHCETLRSLDEGIEQLSCLRELAIEHCHKLVSLPAGLMVLTSLERLEINTCPSLNLSNDDDLKGLISLKKLKLVNLRTLVSLPKGLLDAADTLTHLEIESCLHFTSPSESVLPKLLSLESLIIWHCHMVGTLPEGMPSLTKLQNVRIEGCNTFSRNYERGDQEWRKIRHVRKIEVC